LSHWSNWEWYYESNSERRYSENSEVQGGYEFQYRDPKVSKGKGIKEFGRR